MLRSTIYENSLLFTQVMRITPGALVYFEASVLIGNTKTSKKAECISVQTKQSSLTTLQLIYWSQTPWQNYIESHQTWQTRRDRLTRRIKICNGLDSTPNFSIDFRWKIKKMLWTLNQAMITAMRLKIFKNKSNHYYPVQPIYFEQCLIVFCWFSNTFWPNWIIANVKR